MKYAWTVSRLQHLISDTDRPIVLGGRAMALDRRNKRIHGKVVLASPKVVVLKTVEAPVYDEYTTMPYVSALMKEIAACDSKA
jgi:hypothetical protein